MKLMNTQIIMLPFSHMHYINNLHMLILCHLLSQLLSITRIHIAIAIAIRVYQNIRLILLHAAAIAVDIITVSHQTFEDQLACLSDQKMFASA